MTLFKNETHQDIWRGKWCEFCFQPDEAARRLHGKEDSECPIWAKALRTGRKPEEWERMPRADELERTIKCHSFLDKPAVLRRPVAKPVVEPPLFDDTPYKIDVGFVPVEGWPDRPSDKTKGREHQ